jgi:nitroreductase
MEHKDFLELINTRQSCRDFNDTPIEKEVVKQIAQNAMLAPSACNSQPWRLYCVTDKDKVTEVAKSVQGKVQNKFLDKAKAFICVADRVATLKPEAMQKFDRNHFVQYDVGQVIAYITLGAESMGVKSCVIGWVTADTMKDILGFKEDERCNIVVALGYSDAPIRKKIRKDSADVIVEI